MLQFCFYIVIIFISCCAAMRFDCGQSNGLIGAAGSLVVAVPGFTIAGTFQIIDDCTLRLRNFKFANTVYSPSIRLANNFTAGAAKTGKKILDLNGAPNGKNPKPFVEDSICLQLSGADEFSVELSTVLLYDETHELVLAWAFLVPPNPGAPLPSGPAAGACSHCPSRLGPQTCAGLQRCIAPTPYFRLYWSSVAPPNVDVTFAVEVDVSSDRYFALGWGPGNGAWSMLQTDVFVVGPNEEASAVFVEDYFIGGRQLCNYGSSENAGAVCRDSMQLCNAGGPGVDNLVVEETSRSGSLMFARFTRPIDSNDGCDHNLSGEAVRDAIWAYGFLQNGDQVGVHLRHNGPSTIDFGAPAGFDAQCFVEPNLSSGIAVPPARMPCVQRQLVVAEDDALPVAVTVQEESALLHPSPPGLGVVLALNGSPLAELVVFRGKRYTFTTEPPVLGNVVVSTEDGVRWAGPLLPGASQAFTLQCNATTPDVLFYHLPGTPPSTGWRIYVRDASVPVVDVVSTLPADSAALPLDPADCPMATSADSSSPGATTASDGGGSTLGVSNPNPLAPSPAVVSPTPVVGGFPNPGVYCPIGALNCRCTMRMSCDRGLGCEPQQFVCLPGLDPPPGAARPDEQLLENGANKPLLNFVLVVIFLFQTFVNLT